MSSSRAVNSVGWAVRSLGATEVPMVAYDRKTFPEKETALDALPLGLETTVLPKATWAVNLAAGDGDAALDRIREVGGRVE
ncbi:MAG: hypothetical protein M3214_03360 [Actinomycetota bacterium]|nr:hypothetical protein [Actinomycetota bacterium]